MDKKIVKIIGIVVGVFILLIVILLLVSACSKKKLDYPLTRNYGINKKYIL